VVRGNLRGEGSLEVLGRIEGNVAMTGEVLLAAGSNVRGNVSGSQIRVAGEVDGDLAGAEAVLVEKGASITGELVAPRVGITPGAIVRGAVRADGETLELGFRAMASAGGAPAPEPRGLPEPRRSLDLGRPKAPEGGDAPRPALSERKPPAPVVPVPRKGARGRKRPSRARP
jgi:cytoskeletal protein CcmA (bactofilin family)